MAEPFTLPPQPAGSVLPDIYYIVLDGYARTDVMKSLFDFDNSSFLAHLEDRGFYVAAEHSELLPDTLSLSASLNAVYLDELVKGLGLDQTELSDLIGKSNVVETLRPLGYKFVTFATGFDPTEHPEADLYLSPERYWNGFERMVIDATLAAGDLAQPRRSSTRPRDRGGARSTCSTTCPKSPEFAEPTFTFAHVFCPHPPFIFGENGEDVSRLYQKYALYAMHAGEKFSGRFRDPASFCAGYRGQSCFITRRIQETIDRVLAASETCRRSSSCSRITARSSTSTCTTSTTPTSRNE